MFAEQDYCRSGVCLWRNVIYRAIAEADGTIKPICVLRKETQAELQFDAMAWLVIDSLSLRQVYSMARLEEASGHTYQEFLEQMREKFIPED